MGWKHFHTRLGGCPGFEPRPLRSRILNLWLFSVFVKPQRLKWNSDRRVHEFWILNVWLFSVLVKPPRLKWECGPCPVFASFYALAFALQLRKNRWKPSVRAHILSVCLCSLIYPACKANVTYYIYICGLSSCTNFFNVTLKTVRFS
jgi:hypothetical protein